MEFVTSGSCKRKWLRVDRTIRDLTCGDLEIPLLVIRLGVTGPKNSEFVWLLDLLERRGKKGWGGGDLVYVKRPLGDWAIDGGADVLVTNVVRLREYGFISLGSWSYSREWVWDLRTKLCCIATGK